MQTSRFQLGLIATLAAGLGFSLSSSEAVGYPASAVSSGSNPVWSAGGVVVGGEYPVIVEAGESRVAIVSDVLFTTAGNCYDMRFALRTGEEDLASFRLSTDNYGSVQHPPTAIAHTFGSGVPVPSGETLSLFTTFSSACSVSYTITGYYAQP